MAFDAEWYQSGDRNVVLSYQIATVSRKASKNIIEFVAPGQRLSLAEIVSFGICSVNGDVIPYDHSTARNLVVLVSHSTVAEWSVLSDRDAAYITNQLTAIRKSPVTSIQPIEIVLGDYVCPCHVQLYDTRLIAPADFQSLKRLSTMLGSEDELKVDIGHHYIKHMDWLIRNDYPLYEKYALQDSEITLKLFFLLQSTLMELSHYDLKLYRTIASGAVKGFKERAKSFDSYQKALQGDAFKNSYQFIRSAYHGGRNEGFFVGRSDRYPETSDRLWVDLDFVGAYPTAMALCPMIDCGVNPLAERPKGKKRTALMQQSGRPIQGEIRYLPLRYRLPEMSVNELRDAGLDRAIYVKAKAILDKITPEITPPYHQQLMTEFNSFLKGKENLRVCQRILERAIVYDNSLIDEWYARWNSRIDNDDAAAVRFLVPGFAKVQFAFDETTIYPCLPVPHPSYGLIYPLRGETFVTASEIMLALDAGAEIKALASVELPVLRSKNNPVPNRLFFEHLADLTVQRNKQKKIIKDSTKTTDERQKAIVLERFIKEFTNSFYGKAAQAINFKKTYDPGTGLMVELGPSEISEACTAALATGLPRSALSAILLAIDRYNNSRPLNMQIVVASCTTDGLLCGLPRPEGVTAAAYYEKKSKRTVEPMVAGSGGGVTETHYLEMKKNIPNVDGILRLCGCDELLPMIEGYMPVRQMRNSRRELTMSEDGSYDDTYLEIKHFADQLAGIKTRGQIGWVHFDGEDIVTVQAKFGLKAPVTEIIRHNDEAACLDTMNEQKSMKELDAEYDRIMSTGGTAKGTLECNWILEQIDRINNGEPDIFEYTFYGLRNFNEIIKGAEGLDLTQTIAPRKFNADFDWKRKLVAIGGEVVPFSVPHRDVKGMVSYRGQVEKSHRWGKIATPAKVIQLQRLVHSKTRNTGGAAAKLVRLFLSGMFFDNFPGGTKVAALSDKKSNLIQQTTDTVNRVWVSLEIKFEQRGLTQKDIERGDVAVRNKQKWQVSDIKKVAKKDAWEECVNIPTQRLEELLAALCDAFQVDYEIARNKLFAYEIRDEADQHLMIQVALAILQAPAQGVQPFKRLFRSHNLPDRHEIIREFHPHLPESVLASHDHNVFNSGQCRVQETNGLRQLFRRLRLNVKDADACVQVMLPVSESAIGPRKNPGEGRCVRLFAQALCMPDIVNPPINKLTILDKLKDYGTQRHQLYARCGSKFGYHTIKNTPENIRLIRRLARRFNQSPDNILNAMLEQ